MKMNNRWNRFIYSLWAPVYDQTANRLFFPARKRAMEMLNLHAGERVLLVGVGTGVDLPLLPEGVEAVGVDLSPAMLAHARSKLPLPGRKITLIQGDAQRLLVNEGSFDAILFNLILSVIPDGAACLQENLRALKPGGRAIIFDKFLPEHGKLSLGRRVLNLGSTFFGTDINRRFGKLAEGCSISVLANEPSLLRGAYRVILIQVQ
jgi:phosphatidylethanolamine/phosphatidyl-N-methylethanolamine N-methyltransferase